jgi:hypothetical protein
VELDEYSLELLADWLNGSVDRQEGDRERILEFVDRLDDGSWCGRWFSQRDIASMHGSQQHVLHLREGLRLVLVLDFDGQPDVMHVPSVLSAPT